MKKLKVKAIKDIKWENSCTQLSDYEMIKLKGKGSGCSEYDYDGSVIAHHPNHSYTSSWWV